MRAEAKPDEVTETAARGSFTGELPIKRLRRDYEADVLQQRHGP